MGDFLCLYLHPIVTEAWRIATMGKVERVERVDYRSICPLSWHLTRSCEGYWSHFFTALGAVCYFVHVCETPRNWQLDMSVTAAITPVPYKTSLCHHPVIHLILKWTEPQPELPVICVGDDLASIIWLAELWGLNLWKQRLQKMH